jgi:hypothetical protein
MSLNFLALSKILSVKKVRAFAIAKKQKHFLSNRLQAINAIKLFLPWQ